MNKRMVPLDSDAIADAARPDHYREVAASLRGIAARMAPQNSFFNGMIYAADLLESTARDLDEERIA